MTHKGPCHELIINLQLRWPIDVIGFFWQSIWSSERNRTPIAVCEYESSSVPDYRLVGLMFFPEHNL